MYAVSKIRKKFGEKEVLKGISFELKDSGVVGLLGPNGAGKTTLMRVLVGFLKANEGDISWDKAKIETKSTEYRKKIGYLPENNPIYPTSTVVEYLELMANLKGIDNPRKEIGKVIVDCGIKDVIGQKIETLSKGYRQRVGLAAAIMGGAKLLILDEPTVGLDPKQIIEIRELIKSLAKDRIVLFSTHILPEAKAICDRLLLIDKGKIVLDEAPSKIKNLEKKFVELTS